LGTLRPESFHPSSHQVVINDGSDFLIFPDPAMSLLPDAVGFPLLYGAVFSP